MEPFVFLAGFAVGALVAILAGVVATRISD
jgi:hypothetical protein